MEVITLAHGSGGEETYKLIKNVFLRYFNNDILKEQGDSAILDMIKGKIAITTDSFVVDPLFFKGGDIGKLSICGTVNDLCVSGATPLYISAGFILEEGLELKDLEKIVKSMADTANKIGVKIVTGDTKVVQSGKGHKVYINTTGIGYIEKNNYQLNINEIKEGDVIIISGTIGDHGTSIINERENLDIESGLKSDCAALNELTKAIMDTSNEIRIMRDPTRGGLANTLKELVNTSGKSMEIWQKDIPIREDVRNFCDLLGFDPLYMANEGKLICIVSNKDAHRVLNVIKSNSLGREGAIIGKVLDDGKSKLYLKTYIGGTKVLGMLQGELIPRIC
ncbi:MULTISPECIES: hydrogenase expression/formation protein HypE [unclassified Clostridium]|uniref:hydrogenase expression/formation protein HypE n=1 Tax=unclassified Clostridium TaxID=2614128 RepID=UPI0032165EB3